MRVPLGGACVNAGLAEGCCARVSHCFFLIRTSRSARFPNGARRISISTVDRQPNRHPAASGSRLANSGFRCTCVVAFRRVRGSIGQLLDRTRSDRRGCADRRAGPAERPPPAGLRALRPGLRDRAPAAATALSVADRLARRSCSTSRRSGSTCSSTCRSSGRGSSRRSWSTRTTARWSSRRRAPRTRSCRRASSAASRGKNVELRIALDVTLARTIRVALQASGSTASTYLVGPESRSQGDRRRTSRSSSPTAARTSTAAPSARSPRMPRATSRADDELPNEDAGELDATGDWQVNTITTSTDGDEPAARGAHADHHGGSRSHRRRDRRCRACRRSARSSSIPIRRAACRWSPSSRSSAGSARRRRRARRPSSCSRSIVVRSRVRRRRDARDRRPAAVPRDQAQPPARAQRAS